MKTISLEERVKVREVWRGGVVVMSREGAVADTSEDGDGGPEGTDVGAFGEAVGDHVRFGVSEDDQVGEGMNGNGDVRDGRGGGWVVGEGKRCQ